MESLKVKIHLVNLNTEEASSPQVEVFLFQLSNRFKAESQ